MNTLFKYYFAVNCTRVLKYSYVPEKWVAVFWTWLLQGSWINKSVHLPPLVTLRNPTARPPASVHVKYEKDSNKALLLLFVLWYHWRCWRFQFYQLKCNASNKLHCTSNNLLLFFLSCLLYAPIQKKSGCFVGNIVSTCFAGPFLLQTLWTLPACSDK